ncbi:hypothetical protein LTR09_003891 [Extremus antarcticus]|uniref:Uncharacterized protein n=1 Tax=Extremus antarcticus TaxID=702011 RepID=A0AAJ0DR56_9PEZI|nr:hypothetical protein LTR09_003891 [Extremus antarcticus]
MDEGKATFCAAGSDASDCLESAGSHGISHRGGLYHGNLTYVIPGVENEIQGKWITVSKSEEVTTWTTRALRYLTSY